MTHHVRVNSATELLALWVIERCYGCGCGLWRCAVCGSSGDAPFEHSEQLQAAMDTAGVPALSAMAWTTTPWTLPANQALAISSRIKYLIRGTGLGLTVSHDLSLASLLVICLSSLFHLHVSYPLFRGPFTPIPLANSFGATRRVDCSLLRGHTCRIYIKEKDADRCFANPNPMLVLSGT